MTQVLLVGFLSAELVIMLFGIVIAVTIQRERDRVERSHEELIYRLTRIESRLKSEDERLQEAKRAQRIEASKRRAFEVYGLAEGT